MPDIFNIYLPIADMSINSVLLILLGISSGVFSGMLGLGSTLIIIPALMYMNVDPRVAIASTTNQMTAGAMSGYLARARSGGVDYKLGFVMIIGGLTGSTFGILLFKILAEKGKLDICISIAFAFVLSVIFLTSLIDIMVLFKRKACIKTRIKIPGPYKIIRKLLTEKLPFKIYFISTNHKMTVVAPILIGFISGAITVIVGISGSLVSTPAMLYLMRVNHAFTAGTSNFQGIFVTIFATVMHSITSYNIDIVLSSILMLGTAFGAQIGVKLADSINQDYLRIMFTIAIFSICVYVVHNLNAEPISIYSMEIIKK